MQFGSLKIYANACICIYFNEAFHCKAINCNARRNENFLDLIEKTYPYKGCGSLKIYANACIYIYLRDVALLSYITI